MNSENRPLEKKNRWLPIGAGAVIVVAAIVVVALVQPDGNGDTKTLTVGYSRLRISLPVFVAAERGIFDKHGLDVRLEMYDTAQPLMQALVENEVQVAGYTALPITFNGMLRSKQQLYFLTTMVEDQKHPISYLLRRVAAEGEEPSITSVTDLRGKTIGILPTIAYKAWLEAILKANGLNPDTDVVIQQVAPNLQPQALKSGGVDALFTNDPAATSAIALGVAEPITDVVLCPKYIKAPFPFGSFNVSKAWGDENPEQMKKLVKALNEAIDFIDTHPEEAKAAMRPYLPDTFKPHVDQYPNAYYLRTDESQESTFREIADIYLKQGIIPEAIELRGLVIEE